MNNLIEDLTQLGEVFIFGSSIRGNQKFNDIDIAIIHPDSISFEKHLNQCISREDFLDSKIEPLLRYAKSPVGDLNFKKYHLLFCSSSEFQKTTHPIKEKVINGIRIN